MNTPPILTTAGACRNPPRCRPGRALALGFALFLSGCAARGHSFNPTATSNGREAMTLAPTSPRVSHPAATATAVGFYDLTAQGSLWVHLAGRQEFAVVDMETGSLSRQTHPFGCGSWALPGQTRLLCVGENEAIYLYDMDTGSREPPSGEAGLLVSASPDGTAFLTMTLTTAEGVRRATLRVYDLLLGTGLQLAPQVAYDELWNWPVLSAGGQHVAFVARRTDGGSGLYEMHGGSREPVEIGLPYPIPGGGLAWSPTAQTLAYGAMSYVPEIGLDPDLIYLVGLDSGQSRRLAEAPDGGVYEGGFRWSPDGSMIEAVSGSQICVITVETAIRRCGRVLVDQSFMLPVWSPDEKYLATVTGWWWMGASSLVVIDVDTFEVTVVLQLNEAVDGLLWR